MVRGAPGSEPLLATTPVAPADVGRQCTVVVDGENNASVHPDTDVLVRSGASEVVAPDVERAPNVDTGATGTLVLGADVSVLVRLGPDGVSPVAWWSRRGVNRRRPETTVAPPATGSSHTMPTPGVGHDRTDSFEEVFGASAFTPPPVALSASGSVGSAIVRRPPGVSFEFTEDQVTTMG